METTMGQISAKLEFIVSRGTDHELRVTLTALVVDTNAYFSAPSSSQPPTVPTTPTSRSLSIATLKLISSYTPTSCQPRATTSHPLSWRTLSRWA